MEKYALHNNIVLMLLFSTGEKRQKSFAYFADDKLSHNFNIAQREMGTGDLEVAILHLNRLF